MQNDFVTVDSLEMLKSAFAKLKDCDCHTQPVTLDRKLVGLLTMDNLGEYMRIQAALKNWDNFVINDGRVVLLFNTHSKYLEKGHHRDE